MAKDSSRFKYDPSRTRSRVKRYETELNIILNRLKKEIIALLEQEKVEGDIREFAVSVDFRKFKDRLALIVEKEYRAKAEKSGKKAISGQIAAAKQRADLELSRVGITAMIGDVHPDIKIEEMLIERNLAELMNIGDELEKTIIQQLSEGIMKGEGAAKLSKRIRETTDFAKSRATRVARTETLRAFNETADNRYRRHGVEKVRWKTGGSNICTHVKGFDGVLYSGGCLGLHDEIFGIDEAPPHPLHPNCKCITQAVVEVA